MISRSDLKQALRDRDVAKAAWVQTLSAEEQLALELRETLSARKKEPSPSKKAPARIKTKKKKRDFDREI